MLHLPYLPHLAYLFAFLLVTALAALLIQHRRLRRQEVRIKVLVHQSKQLVQALQHSQAEVRSLERQRRDLSERLTDDANKRRRTEARLRQLIVLDDELAQAQASANQSGFSDTVPMALEELTRRA